MSLAIKRVSSAGGGELGDKRSFDIDTFAKSYGGATRSTLKSGARLYSQGDPAKRMFYIEHGQVQLTVLSAEGKEAIISLLEAGDFSGEGCLIGERLQVATATCLTDCAVARLERASVIRAIHQDPEFAELYLVYVLHRTVRMRDNLISQLFNSSERRLARILLLLANYGKKGRADTVIGKIDQEALAQMVGTTRSRINYFMNKFRKLGYIDYNGHTNVHINVHSSLLNVVLHDNPLGIATDPESLSPSSAQL
jgi:CRP/FNR family transcriptional regulator, cyclic AMP receptor protein